MVGGHLLCLSCFFTCSSVLLFSVCLQDVEASSCEHLIHMKVGDNVQISSCLPAKDVTAAAWKYGGKSIVEKYDKQPRESRFKGRLELNPKDFSLTVRELTVQDSGNFSFVSEVNDKQRETVIINLQVHEPMTKKPDLISNFTWHAHNKSCTVYLECSSTYDSGVSYTWTVANQTRNGSMLQYIIRQDENIEFTCTISNVFDNVSASKIVQCNNYTQDLDIIMLSLAGGGCLMIFTVVVIVVCVCRHKHRQQGCDTNDLTVYADISEVANDETMKPCSVYETIDNRVNTVTPGPQTVYDKIQLSRVRKESVSPYQEIS